MAPCGEGAMPGGAAGHGPGGAPILRDVRAYALPGSLDELAGPPAGFIALPVHVYWAPGPKDLPLEGGLLRTAYQAVIANGTLDDVRRLLNRGLLVREWPRLALPIEAARAWQARFPELRGNVRASW